jgi:hypothetical protein
MFVVFSLTPDQLIKNSVKISHPCVNSDYMLTIVLCYFHHPVMPSEVLYFDSNPVNYWEEYISELKPTSTEP